MTPLAVAPIGEHTALAHVSRSCGPRCEETCPGPHGSIESVTLKDYPPTPRGERLRELAQGAPLSIGEAAWRLGLDPVAYCGLVRGSLTLSDAEWAEAERLVSTPLSAEECAARSRRRS